MIGQRDQRIAIEVATIEVVEVVMEEEVVVVMAVEVVVEALTVVAEEEAAAVTVAVARALGVAEVIALQPVEAGHGLLKKKTFKIIELLKVYDLQQVSM